MKKLLILAVAAISALSISSSAQAQTRSFSKDADTAVNATTVNLAAASPMYSRVTTIQLNVVKVSGTVAGTATVQGSLDGVNYATISSDVLTLADASQVKSWSLGENGFNFYRIKYTTTGTQRSVPVALLLCRKP